MEKYVQNADQKNLYVNLLETILRKMDTLLIVKNVIEKDV